jgi:hypothetical protein
MLPDNHDNHDDNTSESNRKNLNTPKRFNIGYFARETAELLHAGWTVASRHMLADRKQEEARELRKNTVELLELALYDSASRGTPEQQIEALEYFQTKQMIELRRDLQPYTLGEHLASIFHSIGYLTIVAVIFSFTANWSCGSNQSQFCKDVRRTSGSVTRYFVDPN